jgi:hypothetical protein
VLSVNIQKFFFFKFNSLLPANDILKNLIELHVGKENILKEHAMDMPYVACGIMSNRTLLVTIFINLIYIKLIDCSLQKVNFVYFITLQTLAQNHPSTLFLLLLPTDASCVGTPGRFFFLLYI